MQAWGRLRRFACAPGRVDRRCPTILLISPDGGCDVKLKSQTSAAAGLAVLAVGTGIATSAVAAPPPPPSSEPTSAFERNPAPGARPAQADGIKAPPLKESEDDTPLGADLAAVILIGGDDNAATGEGFKGVDVTLVNGLPHPQRLQRALARYVGRPLSKKLISQIQADIVLWYRRAGRPFVSVTPPPQDVTDGVLRMRVIEFHMGQATVVGAKHSSADALLAGIRARPGDQIDGAKLTEDLDWLNHDPFRTVTAVFSPGAKPAETIMRMEVQDSKRWAVFGGYDNTGAASSGRDRFQLGAQVGDLLLHDSLLSLQLTASRDYFSGSHNQYADAGKPKYLTYSAIWAMPVGQRQDLTLSADYIQSTNLVGGGLFNVVSRTEEASLTYRTAVSNVLPVVAGDFSLGVEALGQQRGTFFGGVGVAYLRIDVGKVFAGWSNTWSGVNYRHTFSTTVHVSPGNLGDHNRNIDYAIFTQTSIFAAPRILNAQYVYGTADYTGEFNLPHRWRYVTNAHLQLTDSPLLDTEQMPVGGPSGVRAYTLDAGAFDEGLIWRNELRARSHSLFGDFNKHLPNAVTPYAFLDLGHFADDRQRFRQTIGAAGLGADFGAGHWSGGLTAGWTLHRAELPGSPGLPPFIPATPPPITTAAGHFRFFAHTMLRF